MGLGRRVRHHELRRLRRPVGRCTRRIALKGGSQDFSDWENADVTAALNAARSEPDATKRAQDVIAAQKIITDQLVWVPLVAPNNVLVMNKSITGAPATFQYMFGPWAVYLGGSGS